ncbi:hypothetical protein [Nakamurella flava]|uniref:hypothetical protein n=1 Tax=Nakamurella flava TaxID=2576308 RepID=UPI00197B8EA9|nr:hypothetical protein [Nakamurella flava]
MDETAAVDGAAAVDDDAAADVEAADAADVADVAGVAGVAGDDTGADEQPTSSAVNPMATAVPDSRYKGGREAMPRGS